MLRYQRVFGAAVVIAFMMLATPVAAQATNGTNLFMEAVIDSLATLADAHSVVSKAAPTDLAHMMNTRVAINKIREAKRLVDPFSKSDDEMTPQVASVFSAAYETLALLLGQNLEIYEKLTMIEARVRDGVKGYYAQDLAGLQIAMSKVGAEIDGGWKRVAEISALSTNLLVDRSRSDAAGKLRYLRITSKERANLRARLERFFDKQMMQKVVAGQHAVQVAPALLWQFLGKPEWKPADVP